MSYAQAQIVPLDQNGNEQEPIKCMFNPREYTITRSIDWENQSNDTSEAGNKVFKGGGPAQLSLELFFDTYGIRKQGSSQVEDVRKYTEKLWALTKMEEKNQSPNANKSVKKLLPPKVLFQWGGTWHFAAVIKNIEQQFTLFMPDGTPVRSVVKVTLEQADTETHFYGKKQGGPRDYRVDGSSRNLQDVAGKNIDLRRVTGGKLS